MRILIVDDEALARQRLARLVLETGAGTVVGEVGNGLEALRECARRPVDIVLLDIRMPGMNGIEVARHLSALEHPPAVVFTTAFEDHALAAIEASAVDYLLKPIRRERLERALTRACQVTRAQLSALGRAGATTAAPTPDARTHLGATLNGRLHLLPVAEVRFFRADHKYVVARHPGGELLIDEALVSLETEFAPAFVRAHRSTLIAVAHVRTIVRDESGQHLLRFDGIDDAVEVSRRLVARVRRALLRPHAPGSRTAGPSRR